MTTRGRTALPTLTLFAIASLLTPARPLRADCPEASFGTATAVPEATGAIVSGDFDGDGLANDVAYASGRFVRVLRRGGDGTFFPIGIVDTGLSPVTLLQAVDLDRNRMTDLVAGGGSGEGFASLLNTTPPVGPGGFPDDDFRLVMLVRAFGAKETRVCRSAVTGDVNGDGFVDLVATFPTGSPTGASLFLGNGDGSFRSEQVVFAKPTNASDVALGDVDRDGNLDLVASATPPSVQVRLGNGKGGFGPPIGTEVLSGNPYLPVPQGIALGDLDRDGWLDAVVGSYKEDPQSLKLYTLHGKGDGTFGAPQGYDAGPNPTSLVVADVTRDGLLDVVVGNATGSARPPVNVLVGFSAGGFRAPVSRSTLVTTGLARVSLGDLDADGAPEILSNGTIFPNTCAAEPPEPPAPPSRVVPIVLEVDTGSARYGTELALTNRSSGAVTARLTYTAALGSARGSGTTTVPLAAGQQRRIADVLPFLRSAGLPLPPASAEPQQGGTLRVEFLGVGLLESEVAATARTTSPTAAPLPAGRAGLAYAAVRPAASDGSGLVLFPLRSAPGADRTNLAVYNTSADPVTFRVTLSSAVPGDARSVTFREAETLPAWGWVQYGSDALLAANGMTTAWARIVPTSATGSIGAYAVINDAVTNDGSFVPQVSASDSAATWLTVPVLVEAGKFRSELFLLNTSGRDATATVRYVESASPATGTGGAFTLALPAGRGEAIPDVFSWLRSKTPGIGPGDGTAHVGSLRIDVAGVAATAVVAGVRVAAQTPTGHGQFGLYLPAVLGGEEAAGEAFLYGLRSDEENRTNVAAANTGGFDAGEIEVAFQVHDGDAGGAARGEPVVRTLAPGAWTQVDNVLRGANVRNGWVRVSRTKGTAPWVAYGVVNDGASTPDRTGDGSFVPMVK